MNDRNGTLCYTDGSKTGSLSWLRVHPGSEGRDLPPGDRGIEATYLGPEATVLPDGSGGTPQRRFGGGGAPARRGPSGTRSPSGATRRRPSSPLHNPIVKSKLVSGDQARPQHPGRPHGGPCGLDPRPCRSLRKREGRRPGQGGLYHGAGGSSPFCSGPHGPGPKRRSSRPSGRSGFGGGPVRPTVDKPSSSSPHRTRNAQRSSLRRADPPSAGWSVF